MAAMMSSGAGVYAQRPRPAPFQAWLQGVQRRGLPVASKPWQVQYGGATTAGQDQGLTVAGSAGGGTVYLNPNLQLHTYRPQDRYGPAKAKAAERQLRLVYLHEMGHALDSELTDQDRAKFDALMGIKNPNWSGLPHEQFAEAYAHVAAGQKYQQLYNGAGATYNFAPSAKQYAGLQKFFEQMAQARSRG